MKPSEKRLEYARQYQTMSAKEWRKVVFSDEKNSILTVQMTFRSTDTQNIFHKRITQQGIVEEHLLWSELGVGLNYNLSVVDKKQQIKWRC